MAQKPRQKTSREAPPNEMETKDETSRQGQRRRTSLGHANATVDDRERVARLVGNDMNE